VPAKKRPASRDLSRLKVLSAGDEPDFVAYLLELLASGDRLAREAALDALLERPLPRLREQLRALYLDVDREGEKLDPGAHLRTRIARLLLAGEDSRDVDIALRAVDTYETSMGVDGTSNLRALGLKIIASADPDLFPTSARSISTIRARPPPSRRIPLFSCSRQPGTRPACTSGSSPVPTIRRS
jgi:hypothetical protein